MRQKEGVSRKEPDSKKVHPVYPKENPSAVLPPFPDINQLKLQQEVPKDKLTTFMVMYRTHCQRILDSVSRANFNEVYTTTGSYPLLFHLLTSSFLSYSP
ncbi:Transcription factor RFX4, partial [Geodia barretti]